MSVTYSPIIEKTIEFVKKELSGNDGSHDWFHILRVFNNATKIATEEGGVEDLELVQLAAILHDVGDYKYSGSETAGPDAVREWLTSQNYPQDKTDKIVAIVEGISFKNELGGAKHPQSIELDIVRDADRLDAIGAVGIGRTFCYGGRFTTPMYDPEIKPRLNMTKEEYMLSKNEKSSTINHFYEKLLSLKNLMRTKTGKAMAEKRHEFMELFLKEFMNEWDGHN
jgi:uncharacterized protein